LVLAGLLLGGTARVGADLVDVIFVIYVLL
jgi:hypothetical protein